MVKRRTKGSNDPELFIEPSGQLRLAGKSAEQQSMENGRVECLGMTFESDEMRRAYFLEKLHARLRDPEFRKIEGFPIGEDDDVLALSDPPYYTACPNPFLEDFVKCYGRSYDPTAPYHRAPFAVDVSQGRSDGLYTAHAYHTKVPPKAIVRAILHYTDPGDVVLDGFAGSGMTGVAAQMCGRPDREFKQAVEAEWQAADHPPPNWGLRRAILSELSPAATFIAANYNLPFDLQEFERAAQRILQDVEAELGWMYETSHKGGKAKGRINFTVWSEVFSCPECSGEVIFFKEALDRKTNHVRDEFPCPGCGCDLNKDKLERNFETRRDPATGEPWKRIKLVPVLIDYQVGKSSLEKEPDRDDIERIGRIEKLPLPSEVPTNAFPIDRMYHGSRLAPKGFTHVHHLFPPRQTQALAALWRRAAAHPHTRLRNVLLFFVEQAIWGMSVLARYTPTHYSQVNQYLSGVYYIGSQIVDVSPRYILEGKLKRLAKTFEAYQPDQRGGCTATTSSTAKLALPDCCIDYVFTDPPFGENIYYADLNYVVESWHRVRTDANPEAIVDRFKDKDLAAYQDLMRRCLAEFHRVLKPGRWLTMVFHNSSNAVWNAIQEALMSAGFVVADVRTLDKQQGSYRQITSTAVKQDLVISAYKPNGGLEHQFKLHAGTAEGAWDFVRQHLKQLPVFVEAKGQAETVAERQLFLLFDRMVAFHIQRGATVPLGAAEFYAGLKQKFPERDDMYFLPDQVAEYDRRRLEVKDVAQLTFFVDDERSAIQWLRQQLERELQSYQQIQPKFLRELHKAEHEQLPELREILQRNFLEDDEGRWYVPDPNKQVDLEKQRDKDLLREFEEYKVGKQKRLRTFRTEAVRAGFKAAWAARDYQTILSVAAKLPEDVLQEDQTILMYFDNASMRVGG